jgi:hypothetical protein
MAPRHQTSVIYIRPQRAQKTINHNPGLEILKLIVPPQATKSEVAEKPQGEIDGHEVHFVGIFHCGVSSYFQQPSHSIRISVHQKVVRGRSS